MMDGEGDDLMGQLDDFDQNMIDEANINCPDDQIMNYNHNNGAANNYNHY